MTRNKKIAKMTNLKVTPAKPSKIDEAKNKRDTLDRMIDDRNKKLKSAHTHLLETLTVASDKYKTANGIIAVMDAYRVAFPDVIIDTYKIKEFAAKQAEEMSKLVLSLRDKVAKLDRFMDGENAQTSGGWTTHKYAEHIATFCDDLYDKDFIKNDITEETLVEQLLRLELCRNIGPAIDDIANFITSANEEIDKSFNDFQEFIREHNVSEEDLK